MFKRTFNKFSISLNVLLLAFLVGYFFVPFLNNNWLAKIYTPTCFVADKLQGAKYLPGWCAEFLNKTENNINQNVNKPVNLNTNTNINENINTNVNSQIANPASVKCQQDGGISEIYNTVGGQAGLCIFKDNSICEEWAYFRGECLKGKCFKECKAIGTKSEGWYNSCTGELIKWEQCNQANKIETPPEPLNITVTAPTPNAQLSSPINVEGSAKVKDNKIYIRVKSSDNKILIEETTTVKNIGADGFGDFSIKINYEFSTTKEGSIEFYSKNASGSEENLVSIPVTFY